SGSCPDSTAPAPDRHHAPGHPRAVPTPPGVDPLLELFGELTGVMFCAKDADGRYTEVNDAFVRRTRERTRAAVVGRRARDLFVPALAERYVPALAERYEEQDAAVLASGRPLRHELELIRRGNGVAGWYVTTKLPVLGDEGVVGVVSVSEDLRAPEDSDPSL